MSNDKLGEEEIQHWAIDQTEKIEEEKEIDTVYDRYWHGMQMILRPPSDIIAPRRKST